ncbi:hypothetical protein GHT06_003248 [Daphnia sinensis]|uniref:Uncharacterized protein n=1 Tax=Daphnia sinensis TaxID=1820382 RepID=A0AAD5KFZ9_9CRUS|nr:hypothetical protein GHT06_003248 [Daphnia sinensis]
MKGNMLHEKVMKTTKSVSTNCVFVRRHGERLLFEPLVSDFHDCATDQLGGVFIRLCQEVVFVYHRHPSASR